MKLLRSLYVFLMTLLMYLGTILLGWGLANLPGFFAAPARAGYAVAVVGFALLVGAQAYHSLEGIQDGKGIPGARIARQNVIGGLLVGVLLIAMFVLPYITRRGIAVFQESPWLAWMGVALSALGYWLIYASGRALGRQYSAEVTLQPDHQLITSGPYRWVRHPRYLGILCLALGVSLVFHTWLGLGLCLLVVALVLSRIYDEERLLASAFGDTWCHYCQHSWRLVPYLY